jgi:hypothetical protein
MTQLSNRPKQQPAAERQKQAISRADVNEERAGLQNRYNKDKKQPRTGLREKIKQLWNFGQTKVIDLFDLSAYKVSKSKNTNTYDDHAQRVEDDIRQIVEDGTLDTYDSFDTTPAPVVEAINTTPKLKNTSKDRIDSPQQINQSLDASIGEIKTLSGNFSKILAGLDNLDGAVTFLQNEVNAIEAKPTEENGEELKGLKLLLQSRTNERDRAYTVMNDTEDSIMLSLGTAANGLKAILEDKSRLVKNRDIQDQFLIQQTLIPKFRSVGIEITKNNTSREWDVSLPEFGDIISFYNGSINNYTNTESKAENTEINNESPQKSLKFRLNDPRFAETRKTRMENISNILQSDYDEIVNHYNYPIESNLNEADIQNLKKRIVYTTEKLANWKPDAVRVSGSKETKAGVPTKEQLGIKFKAFDIIADLKKYGLNYKQNQMTNNYDISFDAVQENLDGSLVDIDSEFVAMKSPDDVLTQIQTPSPEITPELAVPEVKSRIEQFVDFTANLRSPKDIQDTMILQSEIDRHLAYNALAGNDYFLGSLLNGEFSFKCVTEEVFNANTDNKAKLKVPYPYTGDTSPAAKASYNIYQKLNIRAYGEIPKGPVVKIDSTKTPSSDRWGDGF